MRLNTVSLRTIILEAIEDMGRSETSSDIQLYTRWATDALRMVEEQQVLSHKIAHLIVSNYMAPLPDDFVLIQQVAARTVKMPKGCARKTRLSQFLYDTPDEDIDVIINVQCRTCGNTTCDCTNKVVEIEVDRAYEMANPASYMKRFYKSRTIGYGGGNDPTYEWKLLRYAQGDFWNGKYFLSDCPNLFQSNEHNSFLVEAPNLSVDFPDGEIILSYLGRPLDKDGNMMVVDHPDLIEAIKSHIKYKEADKMFNQALYSAEKNPNMYRAAKGDAKAEREESFRLYRSSVSMPEFKDFKNWMQRVYMQRIVDHNWDDNANDPSNRNRNKDYLRKMGPING